MVQPSTCSACGKTAMFMRINGERVSFCHAAHRASLPTRWMPAIQVFCISTLVLIALYFLLQGR